MAAPVSLALDHDGHRVSFADAGPGWTVTFTGPRRQGVFTVHASNREEATERARRLLGPSERIERIDLA